MATCLATLPNLTVLSLEPDFEDDSVDLPSFPSPPPLARADLPALTHFFEGDDQYLEKLVARIDAPFLSHQSFLSYVTDSRKPPKPWWRWIMEHSA